MLVENSHDVNELHAVWIMETTSRPNEERFSIATLGFRRKREHKKVGLCNNKLIRVIHVKEQPGYHSTAIALFMETLRKVAGSFVQDYSTVVVGLR